MIRTPWLRWALAATLALAVLALGTTGQAQIVINKDQPPLPINQATVSAVIDEALRLLEEEYVFPELAGKMAKAIRQRQANNEYAAVKTGQELVELLSKHLQEVSKDQHLNLVCSTAKAPKDLDPTPELAERTRQRTLKSNAGFRKVERLDGNIGYLDLDWFAEGEDADGPAAAAMNFLAHTDALIIDVRRNGGGSPDGVALLCSYFFDKTPVHFNTLQWRPGKGAQEFWTLKELAGKRYLGKRVYVLTSADTFSGAEEFAYNLQSRKRAILVGATTGGGAHATVEWPIVEHFVMYVPVGRSLNPITKTNWEGTGVQPDVAVAADAALGKARELALKSILDATKDEETRREIRRYLERSK